MLLLNNNLSFIFKVWIGRCENDSFPEHPSIETYSEIYLEFFRPWKNNLKYCSFYDNNFAWRVSKDVRVNISKAKSCGSSVEAIEPTICYTFQV